MRHVMFALAFAACGSEPAPAPKPPPKEAVAEAPKPAPIPAQHTAMFKPISKPTIADAEKAKIDLGRQLYYDGRLSKTGEISCNSCHMLDKFGVDNEPTSPGHAGERGGRNSPTSFNAALHFVQFWDGRAANLVEQAKGPILNPVEMGMKDEATVEKAIAAIPGYAAQFKAVYGGDAPVSYANIADAIGSFEKYLLTPSRFDAYLAGDSSKLTDAEKKGLDTFIASGCTACHMGEALGGQMYQKLGLVEAYPTKDFGRFDVTKADGDRFMFKVPSLRNVAKTGPYFHDGSVATLDEAIRLMGKHQLGKQLTPDEIGSIATFLDALTGEVDTAYVAKPTLP